MTAIAWQTHMPNLRILVVSTNYFKNGIISTSNGKEEFFGKQFASNFTLDAPPDKLIPTVPALPHSMPYK